MCELNKDLSQNIRVAGIVNDSICDGPGIRFALFVQGCPHHCKECHNPQTWAFAGGEMMSVKEIWALILKNPLLSGITFSGGEPLCQSSELLPLARLIKSKNLELAIYTGFTFEELLAKNDADTMEILNLADTLIDGQFVLAEKNLLLQFKGSENQRILDLKKSMTEKSPILDQSSRWNGSEF